MNNEKFTKPLNDKMINYFIDEAMKLDPTRTSDDILDMFVDGSANFDKAMNVLEQRGMIKQSLTSEDLEAMADQLLGE